tara:strand:- start:3610 stop:3996 length:387 start_codon:yes stop_codon:yes gene_type:complete
MSKKKNEKKTTFWDGAKVHTGAHLGKDGTKTAKTIGIEGAWTLKMRRNVGVRVGCIFIEKGPTAIREHPATKVAVRNKAGEMVMPTHVAVSDHYSVIGAASRKQAIDLCKKADQWCSVLKADADPAAM